MHNQGNGYDFLEDRRCIACDKHADATCFGIEPRHYACYDHWQTQCILDKYVEYCAFCFAAHEKVAAGLARQTV